jgi:hypothetical protein
MKSLIFLRIASVLTLIHSILHTVGGVFGKPASSVAARIAAEMRTTFPAFGAIRSYSDFYLGMGLGVTIFLTMDALLLWVLASMAKNDPARLRPLIGIFAVGYLTFAFNSYAFFFAGPVIFELLIVSCLIAAIITAKPIISPYAAAEHPTHTPAQL